MDAEGWGLWPEQNNPAAVEANNLINVPILPQPGEPFIELNDILPAQELVLDLNAPLEDDLGGTEGLVQADDVAPILPEFCPHPEDVIDEGDLIVNDLAAPNDPLQENANHVEVFIPQEQINPDEIQLEDLMDINEQPNNDQPESQLQLGFVELVEPVADPVFTSRYPDMTFL